MLSKPTTCRAFASTHLSCRSTQPLNSIFPGLGQGCILAQVTTIPEPLIHAAARALATSLNEQELAADMLFPDLGRIREISIIVARAVIRSAQKEGVDTKTELRQLSDEDLDKYILSKMWKPEVGDSFGPKL
jgi:malate dehydrogenase (oxaloacetate-decarboxylating)(NADP+)